MSDLSRKQVATEAVVLFCFLFGFSLVEERDTVDPPPPMNLNYSYVQTVFLYYPSSNECVDSVRGRSH